MKIKKQTIMKRMICEKCHTPDLVIYTVAAGNVPLKPLQGQSDKIACKKCKAMNWFRI